MLRGIVIALLAACAPLGFSVAAAAEMPLMVALADPPQGQFRGPGETLRLEFQVPLNSELVQQLSFELDAIDVSALVQVQAQAIEYRPAEPLAFGSHELRLLRYAPSGDIEEVGLWRFEVRQSRHFQQAATWGQLDATLNQMVHDKNVPANTANNSLQGMGRVQSAVQNEGYRVESNLDFFGFDDDAQSPTGNAVDLNQLYVAAVKGQHQLQLGYHSLGTQSLLNDGYQKRGLSLASQVLGAQASAFAYSSRDLVGSEELLGVEDEDNRIVGSTLSAPLWRGDRGELIVSGGYYYGRRSLETFATYTFDEAGEATVNEGDGGNLALDAQLFSQQLRLRVEAARTRYDFDGRAFGFDALEDDAHSALLMYSPTADYGNPSWSLGLEWLEVGTYFQSIANVALPADRAMQRLFGQFSWGGFNAQSSFAQEENNVEQDENRPTTESDQWFVSARYDFAPKEGGLWRIVGTPSVSVNANHSAQDDRRTPLGFQPTDAVSDSLQGQLDFRHARWSWSLAHTRSEFEDRTDAQIDTETQATQLSAQILLRDWLSLSPGWQWQETLNRDFGTVSAVENLNFAASASFQRVQLSLSWGLNANEARNDPFFAQDNESQYYAANLNWTLKTPTHNRLGFDLGLSLSSQDYRDRLFDDNSGEVQQVLLTLRSTLPFSLPGGVQ